MATVSNQLMTVEQFWDFAHRPENAGRRFDLVRGEIVEMSRAGKRHGFVCANGAFILSLFARQRKRGYVCTNDTGVIVERDPDTVRGPDILFFEDARTIAEIDRKWGAVAPRVAIEVQSPNDSVGAINERIADQLKAGTPLVWLFDPETRTVTVYRPGMQHYVLRENEELTGEDVLPDFRCLVADFFKLPGE